MTEVPHIDVTLNKQTLRENIAKIANAIRPQWNLKDLVLVSKCDGYVNINYLCHTGNIGEGFFVRITNDKMEGYLERAVHVTKFLQDYDLSPRLLATFNNGLVVNVVTGKPITFPHFRTLFKFVRGLKDIAEELARFHYAVSVDISRDHNMDDTRLCDWFDLAQKAYDDGTISSSTLRKLPAVQQMMEVKREIYNELEERNADRCLCHGDPNVTNYILTGESSRPLRMVDTDFCRVDFAVIDIAWLFECLRAQCFGLKADVMKFLRYYIQKRNELLGVSDCVTTEELECYKSHYDLAYVWVLMNLFIVSLVCRVVSHKNCRGWIYERFSIMYYNKYRKKYRKIMGKEPGQ